MKEMSRSRREVERRGEPEESPETGAADSVWYTKRQTDTEKVTLQELQSDSPLLDVIS